MNWLHKFVAAFRKPPSFRIAADAAPPGPDLAPGGADAITSNQPSRPPPPSYDPRLVLFPRMAIDTAPPPVSAFYAMGEGARQLTGQNQDHLSGFQSVRKRRTDPFSDENVPVIGWQRLGR
jgi:hypothetical protein